ncbi:hypothetical protein GCM10010313_50520 [Streptomyces violarus]|uniref:DUF4232 domain-containing protein n=1 Tax=Streptomyces violarus TaxID=67380 RepID=A0A7W4ZSR9_9ACTN|nr:MULTISPECIES: DUF4232 domain-containing protein [Streptomyces]MBB3078039.1 hypothetical protein [Streptomyces violarus]WRT99800.1 DUF4232 domain-containing protein [Streptomyces sp. CGMCC 4.1772]GHD19403.1 hypothetical protein GCM10010313_50520 [Streptomyces violarus]
MNRRLRTVLAVTAVIGSGLLMTACGGGDESSASNSSAASAGQASPTASSGGGDTSGSGSSGSGASKSSGGGAAGSGSSDKSGTGGSDSAGDKSGYGQSCGTNDISWSVSSEDQAGGYFLIKAKAKSGITCVLPAELPVVAFGSDGTQAQPAEQSAGQPITLRAGVTAYAGVNPKTTKEDGGKELDSLIVSVSDDDPNPESLKVGSFVVDQPIVSSWHTSPADAVPFSS